MQNSTDVGSLRQAATAPAPRRDVLPFVVRVGSVWSAIAMVAYATLRAHGMLQELQGVPLATVWQAVERVSVGDAIVCFIGYRLAVELIRAALAPRLQP